ncbi:hypothetical protein C4552_01425 [Candidatus Parcubacteria bacterium]|nr:MAG: hypothetical protein C4552_01425 [Candidatus Parcubacteria bacterium]
MPLSELRDRKGRTYYPKLGDPHAVQPLFGPCSPDCPLRDREEYRSDRCHRDLCGYRMRHAVLPAAG